ncbi:MAG: helix-turn-helix domain-containing protein [Desulfobacteraceae bacterium]|nr:helix-turn-helix domain-containing protein [Desulfobacteraceae bacterium]
MRTNENEYNKGHEQEKLRMARRLRKIRDSRRKKNKQKAAARKIKPVEQKAVEATTDAPVEPPKDAEPLPSADSTEDVTEDTTEVAAEDATEDTTEDTTEDATEDAKFYTAKEAAEMLGISAKQVTAFIQDKSLANAFKKSGRWQIPDSDIQTLKKKLQEPSE